MKRKLLLFLLLCIRFTLVTYAQLSTSQADSVRSKVRVSPPDTNQVKQLLILGRYYIFKPGEEVHDLDTALRIIDKAYSRSRALRYDKARGNIYHAYSLAWLEKGNYPLSKSYSQKAIDLYLKQGDWKSVGYAYSEQSRYYTLDQGEIPKKIGCYQKGLLYFKRAGDIVKQADMYKEMSDLHQIQENYALALIELQNALTLFRSVGHTDLETVYDLMGFISAKLGDFKGGLTYGLMAVKEAEARKDSSLQLCTIYNRVGLTYFGLGQYQQADDYFRNSLAIAQRYNNNAYILNVAGNMVNLLLQQHKPHQALHFLQRMTQLYPPTTSESQIIVAVRYLTIYSEFNQFATAQTYCNEALSLLATKGNGSFGRARIYQSVITFYIKSRQFRQALYYLTVNEAGCRKNGSAISLAKNHLLWFKLDSTQAIYPEAIRHYQLYNIIQDSLLNATKSGQIAQLQVLYETEQKDQALTLKQRNIQLLTKQSQLQQNQLQQAQTVRNAIITGAILLILLLGVTYNRYQLKQRNNRLLETKQREINQKNDFLEKLVQEKDALLEDREWMLKEIHHRVKNNLQIITSLLHSQAKYLTNKAALAAIRESKNRIHTMALIHQKLYQSDRLASISMAEYIQEITDYLIGTFDRDGIVKKQLSITSALLDVSLAIPLGLIINEAVTNSLKHGFPANQRGYVQVELTNVDTNLYQLIISDNGVGLPDSFDPVKSRTLGMSLIRGLSKQLGGDLQITRREGVQISLLFNATKLVKEQLIKA